MASGGGTIGVAAAWLLAAAAWAGPEALARARMAGGRDEPTRAEAPAPSREIPITTGSDEARRLFLEGRRLAEGLQATEARERFRAAVAADPEPPIGWLNLGFVAATNQEFFDALARASSRAAHASEGERLLIQATEAGVRGDPATQERRLRQLTGIHPDDPRAWLALGNLYLARQRYPESISALERAAKLDPRLPQTWNQLGYARRFSGALAGAESAFRRAIELVPDDPNPYDSLAELQLKQGRFREAVASYRQALARDAEFVNAYAGIGNGQLFLGDTEAALGTFAAMREAAVNPAQRRLAHQWTAVARLYRGEPDAAVAEMERSAAVAVEAGDLSAAGLDLAFQANIELERGEHDRALAGYRRAQARVEESKAPEAVKQAGRRALLYQEARVALARGDLDAARERVAAYHAEAAKRAIPFELWQDAELEGRLRLAEGRPEAALAALERSNPLDPEDRFVRALALVAAGRDAPAREALREVAEFNVAAVTLPFVRDRARALLAGNDAAAGPPATRDAGGSKAPAQVPGNNVE